MFGTGIRIQRLQLATLFGRPLNPGNMKALVRAATHTLEEFGSFGDDVQQLLGGTAPDEDMAELALKRTIKYLARTSLYYQKLFAAHSLQPEKFQKAHLARLPVTTKAALLAQQDFLARGAHPFLSVRSSGRFPVEIWLTREEAQLRPALAGMRAYTLHLYEPRSYFHVNLSLLSPLNTYTLLEMADLLDARINLQGLVSPVMSLNQLLTTGAQAPMVLMTYPGYLAELLQAARARGLGPRDFNLRCIDCSGEILSSSLARAAMQTFGAPVRESYGMTEIDPAGATVCREGHLHLDAARALFETLSLETGAPAAVGDLATLVVTPYYPYRLCMPLLRYDTRDVVRPIAQEALNCELAHLPATSPILGRAEHMLTVGNFRVTTRDLVEAIESLPTQPWPARFHASVTPRGIALKLPARAFKGLSSRELLAHFWEARLPICSIEPVPVEQERMLRPLRADQWRYQVQEQEAQRPSVQQQTCSTHERIMRTWPRRYLLKPLVVS